MSFCTVPRAAAAIFLCFFSTSAFAVQPLEITEAFTQAADADAQVAVPHEHLVVIGSNFLNGGEVELALGGFPLTVISQSDSEVVAELPDLIDPGNYQLVVTTGGGTVRHDDFDGVTIGAVGPQGPKGDKGEKGDRGDTGAPGTDGQNGANCYDGIGTSVADCIGAQGPKGDKGDQGEQGPQGLPGADGTPGIDGGPGLPGQSVIADLLPAGSTECPYGGTKFTSVSGINFACNGAPGPQGQSGNLALAGLACPTGQFVIGFDSLGNLQCASVDDTGTQTGPTVTQVPPFGGDLLALEFSGTVSVANTTGDYAEFDGGSAIGTIIADFTCASSNLINTGSGGRVYSFFGPGAGCGEWNVRIVSPTGTTQSLSLNLFVIEVVWDTDLQTFPGGWIRIGNSDSSIGETRTFDMFTAEPLPDGAQLPSSEFLNDSDNFSGIAFNVQDHQIGGLLLTVSGPDFNYAFTEVNTATCAEGETQTAECSTVVEPPFQVCQDGTRTRTCLAGGTWGQWGSCSGAIVSDPSGTCP